MFWQSRLGVLLKHVFDSRLDTEFCREHWTHRMIFFASFAHLSSCDIRSLLNSEENCESCERISDFIHRAKARLFCSDPSLMLSASSGRFCWSMPCLVSALCGPGAKGSWRAASRFNPAYQRYLMWLYTYVYIYTCMLSGYNSGFGFWDAAYTQQTLYDRTNCAWFLCSAYFSSV